MTVSELMIAALDIPEDFGNDEEDYDYENPMDLIREQLYNAGFGGEFELESGASKIVIMPYNESFVIKIPYVGEWWDNYETFYKFIGAEGNGWDYCNAEIIKYNRAKKAGLEMFLVPLEKILTSNDFPAYVQKKVEMLWDYNYDSPIRLSENSKNYARSFRSRLDVTWLATAVECYGEETVKRFLNYIDHDDIDMGQDLHNGNLGYCNGYPVVLDYAGFMS